MNSEQIVSCGYKWIESASSGSIQTSECVLREFTHKLYYGLLFIIRVKLNLSIDDGRKVHQEAKCAIGRIAKGGLSSQEVENFEKLRKLRNQAEYELAKSYHFTKYTAAKQAVATILNAIEDQKAPSSVPLPT